MKKTYLTILAIAIAATTNAQTVLWDGESYELGSRGGCWDDGSPTVVANPETDGINTSAKCLSFTMTSSSKVVKIPFRDWIQPNLQGARRVSLMIKKTNNTNVNIELSDPTDGSTSYWEKNAAWYGGEGQWMKLVFDFSTNTALNDYPGVMSITASTDDVSEDETVYIDNVQIEPLAKVGGVSLSEIEDSSLTGDLTLSGAWMKGDCQNTDGDWQKVEYNDFSTLASKLTSSVTSITMTGCTLKDAYNAFEDVNPNIIIYTDNSVDGDNVVLNGTASSLILNEAYPFHAPTEFQAESVTVNRTLTSGYNTVCLPFEVTATELNANYLAVYSSYNTSGETANVNFDTQTSVAANTPFIASVNTESTSQVFTGKTVTASPESLGSIFVGVYAPQSATGLWGLTDNQFMKGGSDATLNAFHAYLTLPAAAKTVTFGVPDGIDNVKVASESEDEIYTLEGVRVNGKYLPKGIYIINNKKVIVR